MQIITSKSTLVTALGAVTLASLLAACGGGGSSTVANTPATGAVAVSGTATQGQTLTASNTLADVDGLGTFSYQWQADGTAISGATASTLVLAAAQVGKAVGVVISFTDGRSNRESVSSALSAKVAFATSNLQGIWTAGTLGTEAASMVVLSSGASWLLVNHVPVQLLTSTLKGTSTGYDGAGIEYTSGSTPAPAAVSYAAAVVPKQTLTGTVTQTGQSRALSFSYDPRYETAALQTEVVGTWTGTKNAGSVAVTWAISGSGALTGSSTSGCSYGGNVLVHGAGSVPVGVFDLTLVETCSERGVDVVKNFGGIVVLNAAKTGATFAFSTAAGTEGDFLSTSKQQAAQ